MRWRLRCTEEEKWGGRKKERPSTLRGNQGRKKRLQSRPCQWARQRNNLTTRTPERGRHERERQSKSRRMRTRRTRWILAAYLCLSFFLSLLFFPVVFTTSTSQRPKESDCLSGSSEVKGLDRTSS